MITKKMKAMVLAAMIFSSVGIISVSKNNAANTDFKGGAAAALAGAYTGDAVWTFSTFN